MNHFVASLFHIVFLLLIYVKCDDEGNFFDPQNYMDVDCIEGNDYIYLGEKSTTVATDEKNGSTCEIWNTVRNYHLKLFEGFNQFFFADEYMDHNYCRNIPLGAYQLDHRFNNASAHNYVQTDGWESGPWCYVKVSEGNEILLWDGINKTEYVPMPCFKQCSGEPQKRTDPPPLPKENIATTKYNKKLIEHLAQNLFSNFDHGNKAYYESKPSDKTVSADFVSNATIIFYVGMSLLILAVTVVFAKHYYSKWKKRSKNIKKEAEEPVENNNNEQNENLNGQNATEIQKISNETENGPEITKVAEAPKISTENTNGPEATVAEMPKVSNEVFKNQKETKVAAEGQKVSNENQNMAEIKAPAGIQKISTSEEKPMPQKRKLRKR